MTHFIKVPAPESHGLLFTDIAEAARFWSKVEVGSPDACWPFKDRLSSLGYGQIRHAGKRVMAHRIAYMDSVGPIANGLVVRHRCDNSMCCNPAHLQLGTQKDNVHDAISRGRFKQVFQAGA
jgi:hypothetical protein